MNKMNSTVPIDSILEETRNLAESLNAIVINNKVDLFYNPIDYAEPIHQEYIKKFGNTSKKALFMGMNPGPWGMAQTGIPFTDPYIARDWMQIPEINFSAPDNTHENRPIEGLNSERKEASGQLLFGYMRKLFGSLEEFFVENFVINFCPLVMFDSECKNITPEDLLKDDLKTITSICNPYVKFLIEVYNPEILVGIGRFAEGQYNEILESNDLSNREVVYLPHPSPASPIATRDGGDYWRGLVQDLLNQTGILK